MLRCVRTLSFPLILSGALAAQPLRYVVDDATARELVHDAIVASGRSIPESGIQPLVSYWSPEFYSYQAWSPQSGGKPLLTFFFAVNPWNGDVWDVKNCERVTSSAVEAKQSAIWKRSGLPESARDPLHSKVPGECNQVAHRGR